MKQLTKEQHEAILNWMQQHCDAVYDQYLIDEFTKGFPIACCDSCADGDACASEQIKTVEYPKRELIIENDLGASTERDRLMYGVSYLEITNKGIRRIDPTNIRFGIASHLIGRPAVEIPDQRSEFDDNLAARKRTLPRKKRKRASSLTEEQAKKIVDGWKRLDFMGKIGERKEISVDRIPEETSSDYMDRIATINGRK
jgi:hypothetical protein